MATELTVTSQAGREAQFTPSQQQASASPPENPEKVEPSPTQQETHIRLQSLLRILNLLPISRTSQFQSLQAPVEAGPGNQPEAPAQIEIPLKKSNLQSKCSRGPLESIAEIPPLQEVTM